MTREQLIQQSRAAERDNIEMGEAAADATFLATFAFRKPIQSRRIQVMPGLSGLVVGQSLEDGLHNITVRIHSKDVRQWANL
ncbi:hypothetical protein UFOVP75_152 [uncultured Caudovirales phage]|uniref:Uncharacterized protein n=1 Tax=uncultured Caudovirales phage TaxID=2100421 RepID=A0A6J5L646_9CAUD|nr:hypothetical protein UFOVP75_152 [uncultured Caudovirales phage]